MKVFDITYSNDHEFSRTNVSNYEYQEFEKKFTNLKQSIAQDSPSSRLLTLMDEIERLYKQGNLMFAERKLMTAEKLAIEEGAILNPSITYGTPESIQPNYPESEVPEPEVPEPETVGGKSNQNIPESPKDIEKPQWTSKTYQDVSSDIGASFKYPESLNELEARVLVPAHEEGHVARAIAQALVHGEKIEQAYFSLRWKVDYEHHRLYLTGGKTEIQTGGKLVDLRV